LKKAITEELVLSPSDLNKTFELHMDASDFATGGVLMQEGHPITFESRKLNDTERQYPVQEKEMTAVIMSPHMEALLAREQVCYQDRQRLHK